MLVETDIPTIITNMHHNEPIIQTSKKCLRRLKYIVDEIIVDKGEEDYSPIMKELEERKRDRSKTLSLHRRWLKRFKT